MIVPALRTWTAGEIVTAAMLNSNVRDAIGFVLAPPAAALRSTVAQSVPNSSWTSIAFATEDVDNDGGHSTTTNTSRYTAQTPGWYRVNGGSVGFTGNSTGTRRTRLAVNGAPLSASQVLIVASAAVAMSLPVVGAEFYLAVGDYVEVQAYQDVTTPAGGALTTVSAPTEAQSGVTLVWARS